MKRTYVYTVTRHYDAYDYYSIGIAATLPIAKRLAQDEYTKTELPDAAPTLKWEPRSYTWMKQPQKYWVGIVGRYGHEYHIDKQEVITS